jgi:hypothetical protein
MSHQILLALILIFFILQVRQPVDSFKQAYGLYADIWAPLVQSVLNLGLSIIFILKLGVLGVFIGTIIGQITITLIWRPYYLFSQGFKIGTLIYWKGFISHLFYLGLSFAIFYYISGLLEFETSTNLLSLILRLFVFGSIYSVTYFLVLLGFSKGFKNLINRFRFYLKKRLNK